MKNLARFISGLVILPLFVCPNAFAQDRDAHMLLRPGESAPVDALVKIKATLENQLQQFAPIQILLEEQQIVVRGQVNRDEDFDLIYKILEKVALENHVTIASLRTDRELIPRGFYLPTVTVSVERGLTISGEVETQINRVTMITIAQYWLRIRALANPESNKQIRIHPHVVINKITVKNLPSVDSITISNYPSKDNSWVGSLIPWQAGNPIETSNLGFAHKFSKDFSDLKYIKSNDPAWLGSTIPNIGNKISNLNMAVRVNTETGATVQPSTWVLKNIEISRSPPLLNYTELKLHFSNGNQQAVDLLRINDGERAAVRIQTRNFENPQKREDSPSLHDHVLIIRPNVSNWAQLRLNGGAEPWGDMLKTLDANDGRLEPRSKPKSSIDPRHPSR